VTSPLESLLQLGHLHAEAPDAKEFTALKHSGLVRLADAEKVSNSLESRFDLAYSASHALSLAELRYAGYRSAKRYVVFQALPHTLGLGPEVWRVLAKGHEIRNRSEYEGDFYVDERLLADLITACTAVAAALERLPPLAS
jgi:tRNA/tmRNA/rRNA uracil-C5-methylase (TrmA/RlmC/RlmD family)